MTTLRDQAADDLARDYRTNTAIAFAALGAFVFGGSELAPHFATLTMDQANPNLVGAFILNIALILFAWRRSIDLRQAVQRQQSAESRSYVLAYKDEITNLYNRRYFTEHLDSLSDTPGSRLTLVLIDIDHFKRVNDTYGHAAGDAVLKHVGGLIGESLRSTDSAGRLGGEEFVVILRDVDEPNATLLAERLLRKIAAQPIAVGSRQIKVTVSIGGTVALTTDRDVQDTIERADSALYDAKSNGRNRVSFADDDDEDVLQNVA